MLNEFQSIHGLRPVLWLRFIDDIFFIWDNDKISLQSFLKFCNSYNTNKKMKSTINFTFNYSKQEAIFLDTKISFQHNVLVSQLYSKPTSAHQYLQRNSFHPPSLLKSIPKSQFIRIRRICTHLSDYWLHAYKFLEHFSARQTDRQPARQTARQIARQTDSQPASNLYRHSATLASPCRLIMIFYRQYNPDFILL